MIVTTNDQFASNDLTLEGFLREYFDNLRFRRIRHCVLRNHQSLPTSAGGHDIDLLIASQDVSMALQILASLRGVRTVAVTSRPYVVSVFLWGIEGRALQLDLVRSLSWKGLDVLRTEDVLDRACAHPSSPWIPIPDPVDEAIVSFFTSLLLGGFIKVDYAANFGPVFREQRLEVLRRLETRLGGAALNQTLVAAAEGRYEDSVNHVHQLRRAILVRALRQRPLSSVWKWSRHHAREVQLAISGENRICVAFLGPDGSGKTTILKGAERRLVGVTKRVRYQHLRPSPFRTKKSTADSPVEDPHGQPPKPWWSSSAQVVYWFLTYWFDRIATPSREPTLTLYDRYFDDLLVDPLRYRYGGSNVIARALASIVPRPEIVIVLDAPAELLQKRKQEVPLPETKRQRAAYRHLASQHQNWHVVDAARPVESVVEDVVALVLEHMAKAVERRLAGFFK